VRVGIADVDGERVVAVALAQRREPGVDRGERLVPGHFAKAVLGSEQRRAHAIAIPFEVLQRGALRAEVAVAEHVVAVAAHQRDVTTFDVQLEPARRLAEMTRAVRDPRGHPRRIRDGVAEPTGGEAEPGIDQ
jgi:hypothetical protein